MSIVDRIQFLCNSKGTNISNLQKELGFSSGAIYRWDTNSPSVDKLQKVADFFDVSVDSLITSIEKDIVNAIRYLTIRINNRPQFSSEVVTFLTLELEILKRKHCDILVNVDTDPMVMTFQVRTIPFSDEFKKDLLDILNKAKEFANTNNVVVELSPKENRDIARDLEKILSSMESQEAMSFYDGEPLDEESKELLRISLENSMRLAKQMAKKKFTPKKYRKEE